jgi:hypothetical protein
MSLQKVSFVSPNTTGVSEITISYSSASSIIGVGVDFFVGVTEFVTVGLGFIVGVCVGADVGVYVGACVCVGIGVTVGTGVGDGPETETVTSWLHRAVPQLALYLPTLKR